MAAVSSQFVSYRAWKAILTAQCFQTVGFQFAETGVEVMISGCNRANANAVASHGIEYEFKSSSIHLRQRRIATAPIHSLDAEGPGNVSKNDRHGLAVIGLAVWAP